MSDVVRLGTPANVFDPTAGYAARARQDPGRRRDRPADPRVTASPPGPGKQRGQPAGQARVSGSLYYVTLPPTTRQNKERNARTVRGSPTSRGQAGHMSRWHCRPGCTAAGLAASCSGRILL
jgi:hypothetical protein